MDIGCSFLHFLIFFLQLYHQDIQVHICCTLIVVPYILHLHMQVHIGHIPASSSTQKWPATEIDRDQIFLA